MTGEQTTLILGLAVFGMMVLLLSRARRKKPAQAVQGPHAHAKAAPHKGSRKKRR